MKPGYERVVDVEAPGEAGRGVGGYQRPIDYTGWGVILFTVMIGDAARGILFPTLWPLVSSLGGSRVTQGFAVASFSFGRILASPVWGGMSVKHGYRLSLLGAMCCAWCGALMYTFAWSIPSLVISQILIGFGAGSLGVTRAWVAANTSKQTRTVGLARLTALQFFGFTVTPCVGSFLVVLLGDDVIASPLDIVRITKFTAPAYVLVVCFTFDIILLLTIFEEPIPMPAPPQQQQRGGTQQPQSEGGDSAMRRTTVVAGVSGHVATHPVEAASSSKGEHQPLTMQMEDDVDEEALRSHSQTALAMGLVLNIVTRGVIGCFEAMGTAVAPMYGLSATDAGFVVSCCGLVGTFELLLFGMIVAKLGDVNLIEIGLVACSLGALCMLFHVLIPFCMAIFGVYTLGYTLGNTAALAMFSKAAGHAPQGFIMGIFGSAGAGARIVFPITAGFVVHYFGSNVLFAGLGIVSALTIVAVRSNVKSLLVVTTHDD